MSEAAVAHYSCVERPLAPATTLRAAPEMRRDAEEVT
jgi:hypothetical protein